MIIYVKMSPGNMLEPSFRDDKNKCVNTLKCCIYKEENVICYEWYISC